MFNSKSEAVFDYRALRLLVGLVALVLPVLVKLIASTPLTSLSASYYTPARDVFVGSSCVIGALLWAYNGHTSGEKWASNAAALAAILVAIFPIRCDLCEADLKSGLHQSAALILFSVIAYFCLGPFRKNTKGQKGKKGRRARIYGICGWTILGGVLVVGIAEFTLPLAIRNTWAITFLAELAATWAFALAWIVSAKVIPGLVDPDEMLIVSWKKRAQAGAPGPTVPS